MFIIKDPGGQYQEGTTLEEAFENYVAWHGSGYTPEECTWWEAKEIEVKTKIEKVEKTTITKVPNKSRS